MTDGMPEKEKRSGFLARLFSGGNTSYLRASLERHKILLRLSRSLSEARELRPLLRLIASETSEVLHAERATVFLFDRKSRELWSIFAEGEPREIRFPADRGIAGAVFTSGQPINIPDASRDKRWNPEIDRRTGYRTRSMLTVPVKNRKGEIIGVFQVLNKSGGPFNGDDEELLSAIASQVAVSVENAVLMDARRRMFESLLNALADTIDMRDPTTAGHSMKVMEYSVAIARRMGLSEQMILVIRYAAYFHDYGKIAVRDAVLQKPGALTRAETRQAREHVNISKRILERIDFEEELADVPKIAALHHERLDGSGYPLGLAGEQIPLGARIIAVADVFDALTSKRHYRRPVARKKALAYLEEHSGEQFDAEVVRALKEIEDEGMRRSLL
jgi:putative nucleotidyltransferase with HDIG domain